jgi:hypothetical protein
MSNTRRSTTSGFGFTLIDGQKLERRHQKAGGMTSARHVECWGETSSRSSKQFQFQENVTKKIFHTDAEIHPLQKRGASKIVIPGDVSKPALLKRMLQFRNDELRAIDAEMYDRYNIGILLGQIKDFKYLESC